MTPKSENPGGLAGALKSCACGGHCQANPTTGAPPRQPPPKLHPFGRRALDNLRYELMQRGDLDQTQSSAVMAIEHLLRNY